MGKIKDFFKRTIKSLQIIIGILQGKIFTGYVDRKNTPLFVGDTYNVYRFVDGFLIKTEKVPSLMFHPTIPEYFDYFLPRADLIEKI